MKLPIPRPTGRPFVSGNFVHRHRNSYLALRRLLGLPAPKEKIERIRAEEGVPWSEHGIVIPHGSLVRMEYQRGSQVFEEAFLNGRLVVGGKSYDTLSAAATDLARTKDGKRTSLNGWVLPEGQGPGRRTVATHA